MRETIYRFGNFSPLGSEKLAARLENMARRGWRIEKLGSFLWKYRRGTPAELHYTVAYFPDASAFDPNPTEKLETYLDYCREAGWELAAQAGQMQILVSERPDPVPVETEEATKLASIHRSMKKNFLPGNLTVLALCIFQLWTQLSNFSRDPAQTLSDWGELVRGGMWLLLILSVGIPMLDYARWYGKSKRAVAQGGACLTEGSRMVRFLALVTPAAAAVFLAVSLLSFPGTVRWLMLGLLGCYAVIFAAAFGLKAWLKRRGVSRGANRAVIIGVAVAMSVALVVGVAVAIGAMGRWNLLGRPAPETYTIMLGGEPWEQNIYHDPIPLTIEDLTPTDYAHYSEEWQTQSTPLAAYGVGGQFGFPDGEDAPSARYEIVESPSPFLLELCLNGYFKTYAWDTVDPDTFSGLRLTDSPVPDVDAAYQQVYGGNPMRTWIFRRDDRLICLRLDWEATPEQVALAAQTLFAYEFE